MQVSRSLNGIEQFSGSSIILGVFEGALKSQLEEIKNIVNIELIETSLTKQNFSGKRGEKIILQPVNEEINLLVLVGIGLKENLSIDDLRQAAAIGGRACAGVTDDLGVIFPWDVFNPSLIAKVIGESIRLSLFKDYRYRSNPDPVKKPGKIELIGIPENGKDLLYQVEPICAGVELARELVGAPPNKLTPETYAEIAKDISDQYDLEIKVLNRKECEEKNMGAFLAVAKGSSLEPKFIHLIYKSKEEPKQKIAIVGKGLTFDSGGYNLKVGAAQIEKMKYDMGGSAAVIGAARAIAQLKPEKIEVHFIVATCENMINGSAMHPGDIITASNGKTIEVNNTDAEGRLTLADALVYASNLKPDSIIDLATLTGACVIALGDEIAGMWTDSNELSNEIINSAKSVGEGIWRMPMRDSYMKGLKSMLADLQNTGPRAGGSITAALFLREFVDDSIPWAHIDIAGTCWTDKDNGINPSGATGYGVRTLVDYIYSKIY